MTASDLNNISKIAKRVIKERPILFSAPMVQAIIRGDKTQTRRVVKNTEEKIFSNPLVKASITDGGLMVHFKREDGQPRESFAGVKNPYGKIGDRLYVREAWALTMNTNKMNPWPSRPHIPTEEDLAYIYLADGEWQWLDGDGLDSDKSHWKPSIHMPRIASRILLEITDIRVERVQDISEEDAIAEGVKVDQEGFECWNYLTNEWGGFGFCPKESFRTLWQSINGEESWNRNPWVWVIDFKVLEVKGGRNE